MILIADSGSTKTDWTLTEENKKQTQYNTMGYNPYFITGEEISASVYKDLTPKLDATSVKKVVFYGAGCSTPEKIELVYRSLSKCFPNSDVSVNHDMLGAARSLLGDKPGFAAILGTGSNTCIYNGKEIEKGIESLGYILGDEGSGTSIGKMVLRDFMRCQLPPELFKRFIKTQESDFSEIFSRLYDQPLPNRFLASFCKFADENKEHRYIQTLVKNSFDQFFMNIVSKYEDYQNFSFNCVGSVGYIFRDILTEVAGSYGMRTGKIISSPIQDLTDYHILNCSTSDLT